MAFTQFISAQELIEVELGAIEGELKQIERTISWKNEGAESVQISFWYAAQELSIEENTIKVEAGSTANIPVTILLPEYKGDHEFELRVLNEEEDLLVGYQLSFKLLEAEQDVLKAYDNAFWPLRAKENVFNLKRGFIGDTLEVSFDVYNFSGQALEFEELQMDSIYQVHFEPVVIEHHAFARMTVKLISDGLEGGFFKERLNFNRGEKLVGSIPIQYTLMPRPVEASIEAPKISLSKLNHDFKVIKVGDKVQTSISIRNSGAESLLLSKIESNCACLAYELPKDELAIGEEVELKVIFNAKDRIGLERKTLAIFSNDPAKPT